MSRSDERRLDLPPRLEFTLDAFLDYVRYERKLSENTIQAYQNDLEQFLVMLDCHSPEKITEQDVQNFLIKCSFGFSEIP